MFHCHVCVRYNQIPSAHLQSHLAFQEDVRTLFQTCCHRRNKDLFKIIFKHQGQIYITSKNTCACR